MRDIGIFYGSSSGKTESVALRIHQELGTEKSFIKDIADCSLADLAECKILILGVPTWGTGKVQEDWEYFLSGPQKIDLSGKKVAIFGLGDQESYPDTFADAIGIVYEFLKNSGCEFTGSWSAEGYEFQNSAALKDGKFVGLVLDEENQPEMTESRIIGWLKEILPGRSTDLKA